MTIKIKKIKYNDIAVTAELLTKNFIDDKGVIVLFEKNDEKYYYKVNQWFQATLKMLVKNKQNVNCAFWGDVIVGVSIVTDASFKPSILSLLKWSYSVLMTCGMKTVIQSAKHDNFRKKYFTENIQFILEFIAVDQHHRGKGIGRKLFENIHIFTDSKNTFTWLETTKENNIIIFGKMNYHLINTKTESAVKYYIMTNEKNT